MGGSGSTRWHGYNKKTTAEECFSLSISELVEYALVHPGVERRGQLTWSGEPVGYEVNTLHMSRAWVRLSYSVRQTPSQPKEFVDYPVRLVTTYRSIQERDKRMDIFREHPELLRHPDRLSLTLQFLALKFVLQQERRFGF